MLSHQKSESFFHASFCVWIILSPLYFLNNLLSGDMSSTREESMLYQSLKYIACLLFSLSFIMHTRRGGGGGGGGGTRYFFAYIICLFFILFLFSQALYGELLERHILSTIIVIGSMLGLSCVLGVLDEQKKKALNITIAISGVIVSLLSMVEFFLLSDLFASRWDNIGSVRLSSSLLNPNNMGCYIGACFIIVLLSPIKIKLKILCLCTFLFPLIMSGSRTAWIALVATLLFRHITLISKKVALFIFLIAVSPVCLILSSLLFNNLPYLSGHRDADGSSISIRIEKYSDYILGFDLDYLFPDFSSSRQLLGEESGFISIMNGMGIIGVFALLFLILCIFSIRVRRGVWLSVLIYYALASLSINTINSFPNNQMLFVSLGAILAFRTERFEKSRSITYTKQHIL